MKGLIQLLLNASALRWYIQLEMSTEEPIKLSTVRISTGVQQTMNPQQTISDVTSALRPAVFITELEAGLT